MSATSDTANARVDPFILAHLAHAWHSPEFVELMAADSSPARHEHVEPRSPARHKHVEARMLKILSVNRESLWWTARRWAEYLKCSTGTVCRTKTWRDMKATRAECRQEHADRMDAAATRPSGRRKCKPAPPAA